MGRVRLRRPFLERRVDGRRAAGCARGADGTRITLRTAEELNADGTLDTATNRDAAATDSFTLAGTGCRETSGGPHRCGPGLHLAAQGP
ncbi:family 78 glycoside hydrolase catalytic domain [Streptomyces sp. NPDC021212]|uniref:family 78 glycoside hydrolase catalytic domain n=1 Tax=Streptomyces sp. NPDC021212 TaxID=3365118 RepID=UPI00378C42A2